MIPATVFFIMENKQILVPFGTSCLVPLCHLVYDGYKSSRSSWGWVTCGWKPLLRLAVRGWLEGCVTCLAKCGKRILGGFVFFFWEVFRFFGFSILKVFFDISEVSFCTSDIIPTCAPFKSSLCPLHCSMTLWPFVPFGLFLLRSLANMPEILQLIGLKKWKNLKTTKDSCHCHWEYEIPVILDDIIHEPMSINFHELNKDLLMLWVQQKSDVPSKFLHDLTGSRVLHWRFAPGDPKWNQTTSWTGVFSSQLALGFVLQNTTTSKKS